MKILHIHQSMKSINIYWIAIRYLKLTDEPKKRSTKKFKNNKIKNKYRLNFILFI